MKAERIRIQEARKGLKMPNSRKETGCSEGAPPEEKKTPYAASPVTQYGTGDRKEVQERERGRKTRNASTSKESRFSKINEKTNEKD